MAIPRILCSRRTGFAVLALAALSASQAHASADCRSAVTLAAQPNALRLAPIAPELSGTSEQVGTGVGFVPAQAGAANVDLVLARVKDAECRRVARETAPAPTSATPGAYQPKTAYDNTPWRFDMTQNGKRMTADEFDAWMKARGVRVVPAGNKPAAAPAPAPAAPAAEPKKR